MFDRSRDPDLAEEWLGTDVNIILTDTRGETGRGYNLQKFEPSQTFYVIINTLIPFKGLRNQNLYFSSEA